MTPDPIEQALREVPWVLNAPKHGLNQCDRSMVPDYPALAAVVRGLVDEQAAHHADCCVDREERDTLRAALAERMVSWDRYAAVQERLTKETADVERLRGTLEDARYSFSELTSSDDPVWGGYKQEHLGDVDSIARHAIVKIAAALAPPTSPS